MFPYITPLPPAPSRIGDSNNFPAESNLFLSSYLLYTLEISFTSSYLNRLNFNIYNWGTITDINPVYVEMNQFGDIAQAGDIGSVFASKHDAFLAKMELVSYDINNVVDFVQDMILITGAYPGLDISKPVINNNLGFFPTRSDTVMDFESKSVSFYTNVKTNGSQIKQLHDYVYRAISPIDSGFIVVAVDEVIDFGLISEGV